MKPKQFEELLRKNAPGVVRKLVSLTKSRDKPLALRAIKTFMQYAYGEPAKTEHDPWKDKETNTELRELIKDTLKDNEALKEEPAEEKGKDE